LKILAIDTSTEACSAALLQGEEVISRYELAPRRHAELILPMVDELLSEAGLTLKQMDCLAFGNGPGAFTGIRIAAGITQGLAFSCDLPVVPVSSLAALAQQTNRYSCHIFVAIDARMEEIYHATYRFNHLNMVELVGDETVSGIDQIVLTGEENIYGVGSGWAHYGDALKSRLGDKLAGYDSEQYPRADVIAGLAAHAFAGGKTVSPENAIPNYLRDKVIK